MWPRVEKEKKRMEAGEIKEQSEYFDTLMCNYNPMKLYAYFLFTTH